MQNVHQENEIDLVEIIKYIKKNTRSLLVVFLVCLTPFVLYLSKAVKVYRAEAYLSSPLLQNFNELNVYALSGHTPKFRTHTSQSVYGRFLENLHSHNVRWDFYVDYGLHSKYQELGEWKDERHTFLAGFSENLLVEEIEGSSSIKVIFDIEDENLSEQVLSSFLEYVKIRTVRDLFVGIEAELNVRRARLLRDIESKRRFSEVKRSDSLIILIEALEIANRLELETVSSTLQSGSKFVGGVSVNTADNPLYMRGKQALAAEIDALKLRKSDDPFVGELRVLQERLSVLEGILIDRSRVDPVNLDQSAQVLQGPIEPRIAPFISLGILVSLMFTVVFQWIRYLYLAAK